MLVSKDFLAIFLVVIALALFLGVENGSASASPTPVVQTTNGPVRGTSGASRSGKIYHQFLGIPFAKPPIKSLRFERPQKPENWTVVKDTMHFQEPCLQFEIMFVNRIKGVEDCLYLNVFTPNLPEESNGRRGEVPVMVFIHGGGFTSGNPRQYGGKYLIDEDVILVTIAYRLGSFGFLSTGDELVRGNMGLWDQNLALHWIKDNIKNFGGDPNKVTLFGESSGASAVHWHVLSPKSNGLFQKAISQTGSALRRYPNTNDFAGQARSLASRVLCPTNSMKEMVACLKTADPMRIVETHRDAKETLRSDYSIYGPIVDPVKDDQAFITDEPETLLQTGNYAKIPWITGINSADGILFASSFAKDTTISKRLDSKEGWRVHLPRLLRFDDNLQNTTMAAEKIRDFYFKTGSLSDPNNFPNLINMFSDRMYFLPNFNSVNLQSPQSPVYLYYFDYKTALSIYKLVEGVQPNVRVIPPELQIARHFVQSWINENLLGMERPFYGAAHADELSLIFNLNPFTEANEGTNDYKASKRLVRTWADFARNNATEPVIFDGITWPVVSNSEKNKPLQYVRIGDEISVINDPIEERMRFWKSLNLTFLGRPL